MKITVNGVLREAPAGASLANLLQELALEPARVVVERNREIVPRDAHGDTLLAEGDVLEIVRFVGGG